MGFEALKTVILLGENVTSTSLGEVLSNSPQVELLGQATSPEDLLNHPLGTMPELVIVDLDNQKALPEWLENLNKSLSQTTLMVCSENRDPDFLIHIIQMGIREFLPMPLNLPELEGALERIQVAHKQRAFHQTHQGQIVVVTGLKGGMGVTSIAVNLAVSLAERAPKRVVLVDLGRPFPDIANFLDQKGTTSILDLVEHSGQLEPGFVLKSLQTHADNFSVLHGCRDLKPVDGKSLERIWDTLGKLFEWVVVDLSNAPDVVNQVTLRQAQHVLMLTDLLVPNLENLKRWWEQYEDWQLDRSKVKVIVNRYQKDEGVVLEELSHMQKHPVFFTLPNDYMAISDCINHGLPLKDSAPRSKLNRSLEKLAEMLAAPFEEAATEQAPAGKKKRRFWFF
jgi:pilus assembly protein CpaE